MFSESKVTGIYCMTDDFCKEFAKVQEKYMVKDKSFKHRRHRAFNNFIANELSAMP